MRSALHPASKRGRKPEEAPRLEYVDPRTLKAHPRNYRDHPDDQLQHITQSIKDNGFYRNVVLSRDGVLLAGHGVVEAALRMKRNPIPAVRLGFDSTDHRALKVLAGDNEIAKLAKVDDRKLTELLREIMGTDPAALTGTGFDQRQLAALLLVTRHPSFAA